MGVSLPAPEMVETPEKGKEDEWGRAKVEFVGKAAREKRRQPVGSRESVARGREEVVESCGRQVGWERVKVGKHWQRGRESV